mmetsp:Transcript_104945/g.208612  ORF Transcript_104945/g.208612 Transcript_104945/m.208612 type:complete len:173 (-) Transcript_104945:35-553(-)
MQASAIQKREQQRYGCHMLHTHEAWMASEEMVTCAQKNDTRVPSECGMQGEGGSLQALLIVTFEASAMIFHVITRAVPLFFATAAAVAAIAFACIFSDARVSCAHVVSSQSVSVASMAYDCQPVNSWNRKVWYHVASQEGCCCLVAFVFYVVAAIICSLSPHVAWARCRKAH